MRARRSARVGGISFVEWPADHHGDWFVLDQEGIKSVWGGVDVRREDVARPAAHGSFDLPGYLTPRVIPISGHMSSRSAYGLEHSMARLSGLLADGGSSRLTIEGSGDTRWCDVRLASATQITQVDATTARFLVTFWAADPRMYGEVDNFPGGVEAVNRGNFPATPEHLITGTSGGYTINGPSGKQFIVSSGPGSGTDRIDMETGRVYRNGSLQLGIVSRADLWAVPPGVPGVTHTVSAGSLVTRLSDTFV
jgi:phage-related protein